MERLEFSAKDGTNLVGVLETCGKTNAPLIILCHGITVTRDEGDLFVTLSDALQARGFDVFRFDFRGHGESSGRQEDVTVFGEVLDLEAAFDLCKARSYARIGLLGASFGGATVSSFLDMEHEEIKTVVLWNPTLDGSTFTEGKSPWAKRQLNKPNMERLSQEGHLILRPGKFRLGKVLFEELRSFSAYHPLSKTDLPILIIHGDKDSYIPYSDSVKATVVAKNCTLEIIEGADHGFSEKEEQDVIEKTASWFSEKLR